MGEEVSKSTEVVVTFTSLECSNDGRSGREGTSFCSSASILRQILDGVSTSAMMILMSTASDQASDARL